MEISPRELRDIEIREAFRGYNRDEVNELLDRAAATIDALTGRVRELGDRLAEAPGDTGERSRDLEEMLERTLLLAKRTADEEVTEAQAKARQLVDDAETKARKLVLDAEVDARRRAEEEQGKIRRELIDFGERRDALAKSVVELEKFETEYRERLLRSIEADLAVISGRGAAAPGPSPEIEPVEIPPLPEAVGVSMSEIETPREPAPDPETGSEPSPDSAEPEADAKAMLEAAAAKAAAKHEAETRERGSIADEPTAAFDTMSGQEPSPGADRERSGQIDLLDAEAVDAEVVRDDDDDDEFFTQLREAVSDDRPSSQQEAVFFDQDTDSSKREMFRRRR